MSMLTVVWKGVKNYISELYQRITLPATEVCRLGKKRHKKMVWDPLGVLHVDTSYLEVCFL